MIFAVITSSGKFEKKNGDPRFDNPKRVGGASGSPPELPWAMADGTRELRLIALSSLATGFYLVDVHA